MTKPAKIVNFVFLPHFYLKILAFTFFLYYLCREVIKTTQ